MKALTTAFARFASAGAPAKPDNTPYLAAQRTWNDHVARLVVARFVWQIVALLSLLVALGAVGGLVYLSGQSKLVPYIVEVDSLGNVRTGQRAQQLQQASSSVVQTQLEKFISLARRVTPDVALQRNSILGAYSLLSQDDPATNKLTEWFNGDESRTPFKRAETETVAVEVSSVLQQTQESWQIEWSEIVYSRDGKQQERFRMQALLQVYQIDPQFSSEEELQRNPLGVFVRDFSWNRKQAREVQP